MLWTSFWLLGATAILGLPLAIAMAAGWRLRRVGGATGLIHAICGLAGFTALILGLRGPVRGLAEGMGKFGQSAAVVLAVALLIGLFLGLQRLRRHPPPPLIAGLHATVAIMGFVVLAAYVTAPPG